MMPPSPPPKTQPDNPPAPDPIGIGRAGLEARVARAAGSPLVRGGLTIVAGIVTGNILGFFRVALTAYFLGTHSAADSLAVKVLASAVPAVLRFRRRVLGVFVTGLHLFHETLVSNRVRGLFGAGY